jgi:hypothetical protein
VSTREDESHLVLLISAVRERIGVLVDLPPTPDNLSDLMLLFEQFARLEQMERDAHCKPFAPSLRKNLN